MATKKPAVAIALKHVDTTGIELKQIIGPPKDQDHKRRSLNTSIQRASHVPPTAAPFVPLEPLSAPPPRSQLHPHSSFCKSHPSLQKIERERIRSSGSLLTKIKRSMARITNNDDIEDDDSDSETDTDTDTDTDDDEDSVYELDDDTDVLNFVNFSGEEKLHQKSKRKKGRGKRKGRGGRGSKPVKGRGGHGHSKTSSTSGKSSNKHARAKSKALKLILYQKAVESLYDDISGNMQPRMGIAKVTPFAQTWPHYYKCSCLYSSIRMSIVLLLSLVGGFFQVFPLLLSFTWTKSVPFREIMLAMQWSVITALAIMTFALNKWRFRGIGTIGVGILCGLMVQELLFPGRYCYSLLGGSGTIPLDSYLNYTTASKMERYKPDMNGYASTILYTDSLAPSCYNTTTAQRASEPFAWAVAMPIERSSTNSNNQGGWRREVIFGTLTLPDILSLSLHGLSRTSSTGLMLYVYGCGWLPMLSGVMMGPIYVMGKYLPASIQFCPSLVKTANCTEEALWGMYAWCCIVLSLMVYRGTKRNQIARTGLITFIIFNIWIVTTEFILLYSGKSNNKNRVQKLKVKITPVDLVSSFFFFNFNFN